MKKENHSYWYNYRQDKSGLKMSSDCEPHFHNLARMKELISKFEALCESMDSEATALNSEDGIAITDEWKFLCYDTNGDGVQAKDEFCVFCKSEDMKKGKPYNDEECDGMWTEADADKDGVVTLMEFTAFMKMMREKMKEGE